MHANFAQFLDATGSRSEAIVQGKRACELVPDLSWPCYDVGALLMQEGRVGEAAVCFERALELGSDFTEAQKALQLIRLRYPHVLPPSR